MFHHNFLLNLFEIRVIKELSTLALLGSGKNIVLFNDRSLTCNNVKLYYVDEIEYKFSKITKRPTRLGRFFRKIR